MPELHSSNHSTSPFQVESVPPNLPLSYSLEGCIPVGFKFPPIFQWRREVSLLKEPFLHQAQRKGLKGLKGLSLKPTAIGVNPFNSFAKSPKNK